MKKSALLVMIAALAMILFPATLFAAGQPAIQVMIDGGQVKYDVEPIIVKDRTFVQFRPTFEDLGMTLEWDPALRKITGTKQGYKIELTIGSTTAYVNGTAFQVDAAPFISNDYTMIPLRFISEATGRFVNWNNKTRQINIVKTDLSQFTDLYFGTELQYRGDSVDGKPQGSGKLLTKNGILLYEGDFKDGKMDGKGKYYDDKGYVLYEGDWKNGLMDGTGKWYYGDGDLKYEGGYKAGKRQGDGKFIWRWQSDSQVANPSPNNAAEVKGDNTYIGSFANDKFAGQGTLTWADGSSYKGGFVDGMLHGKGEFVWADKWKYVGQFAYGDRSGEGELYNAEGKLIYKGTFKNNLYSGQGEQYDESGKLLFKGEFVNGQPKK